MQIPLACVTCYVGYFRTLFNLCNSSRLRLLQTESFDSLQSFGSRIKSTCKYFYLLISIHSCFLEQIRQEISMSHSQICLLSQKILLLIPHVKVAVPYSFILLPVNILSGKRNPINLTCLVQCSLILVQYIFEQIIKNP